MPPKFEIYLKGVLVTCVGILASSLGVFISILSVIVSPLFSLFLTPKPIFIGGGKTGPTPRLQHPSQKIRPRHIHRPSSDKSSSHSSNTTASSSGTTLSISSNQTAINESQQDSHNEISNISELPAPSRPPTPRLMSGPSSPPQPRSPRNGLRTYLGMRKRSTLRDENTPAEPNPTASNEGLDLDKGSHEQELDRAEIIISPPTPSSSIFLHSAPPGLSEGRFGNVSTAGKPAARFVKTHSKRHSLTAACPRKRRSAKRPSNPSTPTSSSPVTPVVESRWHIATRAAQRKKRKSLRIDPPRQNATSPVLIETGDDVGGEIIHEEPISITRPPIPQQPPTPARQGPVRTRPYEAPYFFPSPGSPEAIGYVDRVREERRSVFVQPDAMLVRGKKRSFTTPNPEKGGAVDTPKLHGEGSHDQATEDNGRKRPGGSRKGSGDRNLDPIDESGVLVGTPTNLRKASAPPQFSPSPETSPSRPRMQRQGSSGIMRILGKH